MSGLSRNPCLYQVNTKILLHELSQKIGKQAKLQDIPNDLLDQWAKRFEWIWLLGVWQTGPKGRDVSLKNEVWIPSYKQQLPDYSSNDISGSPFAIQAYTLNSQFGSSQDLTEFRKRSTFGIVNVEKLNT